MIDIRYHIASIVAVFVALGLGILIGSTIVGDNLLVDQQKKMIERLDEQFSVVKERETEMAADSEYKEQIIANYENYSQAVLPLTVDGRLEEYKVAIVITGDTELPAGMVNALSIAGAQVVSKTVLLSNMQLYDETAKKVAEFYGLEENAGRGEMRKVIAESVARVILNQGDPAVIEFLQQNGLVKFSGANDVPVDGVILVGGTNSFENFFASDFDQNLIQGLSGAELRIFGVEGVNVNYSYMGIYQENNISTIDNIDRSPGQVSLVLAMEGESGDYGVKPTAKKFMPTIPVKYDK